MYIYVLGNVNFIGNIIGYKQKFNDELSIVFGKLTDSFNEFIYSSSVFFFLIVLFFFRNKRFVHFSTISFYDESKNIVKVLT